MLSKILNQFDQLFFIKIIKSVINCTQNILILNLLNLAKSIQHFKKLIENSRNIFYKITEFLISLKEIDIIKTLINDLKNYQDQMLKIQSAININVIDNIVLKEITILYSTKLIKKVLNSANDRVATYEEIQVYQNLLKVACRVEKRKKKENIINE